MMADLGSGYSEQTLPVPFAMPRGILMTGRKCCCRQPGNCAASPVSRNDKRSKELVGSRYA